jgi:hypothetical protein
MQLRLCVFILLIAWLALAGPLAIFSWLAGAHVTFEQQIAHEHAVAIKGGHVHASGTLTHEARDGFLLSVDLNQHTLVAGSAGSDGLLAAWVALLLAFVLLAPLPMLRLRPVAVIPPASRGPAVLRRPPQRPAPLMSRAGAFA